MEKPVDLSGLPKLVKVLSGVVLMAGLIMLAMGQTVIGLKLGSYSVVLLLISGLSGRSLKTPSSTEQQ